MTGEHVQVLTTTEAREEAESIARALTEQRLAACVQIVGPVTSSRKALYERIEQAIKAIHSYETPEIIALPIVAGSAAYLNWLDEELKEA